MDKINKFNLVHRYEKRSLLIAINLLSCLAIFFFGYDQGMMGSVNVSVDYAVNKMKFGSIKPGTTNEVVVDKSLLQGGITSVYYLGTLVGCLWGGWIGEKVGRIKVIGFGCVWGVVGASLQTSAMNANWMICARMVNGIGTGMLNVIVPVWSTETASHTSRGMFIAIEFTLNIFGVVVAYWLGYGCSKVDGGLSEFVWRFPIAFQIIPLLFLLAICWYFPESPRWLVKVGRLDEARYILGRLRGEDDGMAEAEFSDIVNIAKLEREAGKGTSYFHMFWDMMPRAVGGGSSGTLHIGRRVFLVIWLQILQEWIGIAGVTIYANDIFSQAGYSTEKARWLAGTNDIFYMFSTLICVFTLDRLGRRITLYWGSVVMGISMFLSGGLSRAAINNVNNPDKAAQFGAAAASFTFVFTAAFGATWLTVPWLYPAEIFPLAVRAKGNAWGVVGWSIGNGWTVLLLPTMFEKINEKTFYVFGATNAISIPIVWALYPESARRTLEEMDLLFASPSWWNWDAEKTYARLKEENPELVQAAQRGQSIASGMDPEKFGEMGNKRRGSRGLSLAPGGGAMPPAGKHDESPESEERKL